MSKHVTRLRRLVLIPAVVASVSPPQALAQGETTSAIVGQVRDTTNAVVPGASVTIANPETGLKRSAKTDDAGRFNFPQLKPGSYSNGNRQAKTVLRGLEVADCWPSRSKSRLEGMLAAVSGPLHP